MEVQGGPAGDGPCLCLDWFHGVNSTLSPGSMSSGSSCKVHTECSKMAITGTESGRAGLHEMAQGRKDLLGVLLTAILH